MLSPPFYVKKAQPHFDTSPFTRKLRKRINFRNVSFPDVSNFTPKNATKKLKADNDFGHF